MITFNEFLEVKKTEITIKECAHLMVELDVNPHVYIYECLKRTDPVLAESFWSGVKAAAGNIWKGVKQFAGDVAQGAQAGYNRASDTIAGPVPKFDSAIRALEDLEKTLSAADFARFMSSTGRGTVAEYVRIVKEALMKDKGAIPQRTDTKFSQPYDTRQNVANQRAQAAAGQQPTRESPVLGADGRPMVMPAAS